MPQSEVTALQARHLSRLEALAGKVNTAAAATVRQRRKRDLEIAAAVEAGLSLRQIASVVGMSAPGVKKAVDGLAQPTVTN